MVIESYLCRTEGGPGITLSTPLILYMTVLVTSGLPCLGQRSTLNPDVLGQRALYSVVLPVTQHLTCFIIPIRSSLPFLCIWDTIILLLCSLPVSAYSLVAGPLSLLALWCLSVFLSASSLMLSLSLQECAEQPPILDLQPFLQASAISIWPPTVPAEQQQLEQALFALLLLLLVDVTVQSMALLSS